MTAPLKYGLLGWPVKHSVSPQMQGAGFQALGLDATYELLPIEPENFDLRIPQLVSEGFEGWNITIPHKGAMFAHLDQIDPVARHAESVNTVCNRDGRLHGYSTDGYGLERALNEAFGIDIAGGTFIFWGTGGATRATATHFAHHGAAHLVLVNRTVEKAVTLAVALREFAPKCEVSTFTPTDGLLPDAVAEAPTIIQATSVGMDGETLAIPTDFLTPGRNVMDMIYRKTPLLQAAEAAGCRVADGRAMLLYQGVKSFEIWTDQSAPVDVMRQALKEALQPR